MFTPAVLITGGVSASASQSAEIYHPDRDTPCVLPELPDRRKGHTQDGSLMCGGFSTRRSCRKWNPDTGAWDLVTKSLQRRRDPISWTSADGSVTYLMGGYWSPNTSDVLDNRSGRVKPSFPLKYKT